uniref:NR LBD domain-containing protein n=1 Tax=Caenorhabditis tropicalis TaxID=1561998 RepID=A0A1I7US00_9PELO
MDFTGVTTNLPTEILNHNRLEIQRLTLLRNAMHQQGADPAHLQLYDVLIYLNSTMITLGEEPLSHAGLVAMLETSFSIRTTWAALNVHYD